MGNKQKDWEEYVKNFVKEAMKALTRERGNASSVANALGLTRASVSDIKTGRSLGSTTVNIRMLFMLAGISDEEAKKILQSPELLVRNLESKKMSELDTLYYELKSQYSENELAAWMKLLKSKRSVEDHLGIVIKAKCRIKV